MNELRMKYIVNQIEILHVILGLRNTPLRFQLSFQRYFLLEKAGSIIILHHSSDTDRPASILAKLINISEKSVGVK